MVQRICTKRGLIESSEVDGLSKMGKVRIHEYGHDSSLL